METNGERVEKMSLLVVRRSNDAPYEQRERLRNDYKWIVDHKAELIQEYPEKYIAVIDRKVVLVEDNVYAILNKIRAAGLNPDKFAVEYVSGQPICFLL